MVWCRTFCVPPRPRCALRLLPQLGGLFRLTTGSDMQSQVKHEARGAGNAAKFFTDGVTATISTAAQVLRATTHVRLSC